MLPSLRYLQSMRLANVLSFGAQAIDVEFGLLNVLIGANASGKSNLVSVLHLLAAAPRDLQAPIREGGGADEWLWKGGPGRNIGKIDLCSLIGGIDYAVRFSSSTGRLRLESETLDSTNDEENFFYRFDGYGAVLRIQESDDPRDDRRDLILGDEDVRRDQSILSQRKDPDLYPELTAFGRWLERFRFYRGFDLGRTSPVRAPQRVDLPDDFLLEDASNLGLVLSDLLNRPATKRVLLERLRRFYERVTDIAIKVQGGTVQIFFHEEGFNAAVPAIRLSDGTLRYLCLLTVLCHPQPPPLICIEEPEIGLHPDVLPDLGEMLVEASARTQLVVTTHSDALVSALSDTPESILVCERGDDGTTLRRLDKAHLAEWLERYRLGDLWRMGEIGGNRW
jgi:predicted ATPase